MQLEIDSEAAQELATIGEWYAVRSVQAESLLEVALDEALDLIQAFPYSQPIYEMGTRRLILQKFPLALIYCIEKEKIRVMAVMPMRRRPGYWWERI